MKLTDLIQEAESAAVQGRSVIAPVAMEPQAGNQQGIDPQLVSVATLFFRPAQTHRNGLGTFAAWVTTPAHFEGAVNFYRRDESNQLNTIDITAGLSLDAGIPLAFPPGSPAPPITLTLTWINLVASKVTSRYVYTAPFGLGDLPSPDQDSVKLAAIAQLHTDFVITLGPLIFET